MNTELLGRTPWALRSPDAREQPIHDWRPVWPKPTPARARTIEPHPHASGAALIIVFQLLMAWLLLRAI